jgi:glycosyltransferase 2 family protein
VAAVAAGAGGLALLLALTLAPGPLARLLARVVGPVARGRAWGPAALEGVAHLAASLALLRSPARAARLVALTLMAWLLEGAVFATVAWSLKLPVPPQAPWLAMSAATLATLLPSSPGYVGTFDYFGMTGLTVFGAGRAEAAAFALLAHFILWLPVTVAGYVVLLLGQRTIREPALGADAA